MIIIGIDPGESTGLAVYNTETALFEVVQTFKGFYQAASTVDLWRSNISYNLPITGNFFVVVEDARLATFHRRGANQAARAQGAGDVKGICREWERMLINCKIPHRLVRPCKHLNLIAENKKQFALTTQYTYRTSHHARVAAHLAMREAGRQRIEQKTVK